MRVEKRHWAFPSPMMSTRPSTTRKLCVTSAMQHEATVPKQSAKHRTPQRARERGRWPPSKSRLEQLIAEATVDAYGDSEQRVGLLTMLEENLVLPFETCVLGVGVVVERIDLTDAEEIVAICRHGRDRQAIPILDLPLPSPRPAGAEWIEAYRRWARGG